MDLFTSWYNLLAILMYGITSINFLRLKYRIKFTLMLILGSIYAFLIMNRITSIDLGILWASFNVGIALMILSTSNINRQLMRDKRG